MESWCGSLVCININWPHKCVYLCLFLGCTVLLIGPLSRRPKVRLHEPL